ncbi:hypothetical protein EZV62_022471 [Acer yangbiense]|uniref:Uncharacterized protein n=1 Tax=Acer yangbiense TaxID=1000413 RepID=A0A5C7H9N9_9ROSI|nr:hypothetical protein EZV62_022471 [Acer yangbiense]
MTKEMGEFLGRIIGDLVDIDIGSTSECFSKYLRVRVAIDVSKPLKRFLRMDLSVDDRHSYSMCMARKEGGFRDAGTEFDFGPWMRATSLSGNYKQVSEPEKVHVFSVPCSMGRNVRGDADMTLDGEKDCDNYGNQDHLGNDPYLKGKGLFMDANMVVGGEVADGTSGNQGLSDEGNIIVDGGPERDVVGQRSDVVDELGLHKVSVVFKSPIVLPKNMGGPVESIFEVWHRRNQALHGLVLFPVSDIWEWANNFVSEFRKSNIVENKKHEEDILCLLSSVDVSSISFVPRLDNKVAHGLAKISLDHVGHFVWLDDCPLSLESLVLGDYPGDL